ncbi:hypothetical protein P175DRAFT_0531040 [Aspergillus ochraceoroseus IBT 24754]|uniref:Uncharacterized protein n=1 Tax=Aspergillus ochraceoroseus IBT 24754 TaxID=1392256 RepID=A0A2T5LZ28_9EURO|nr:uncharacterized protein P175DRAFT_0531040 [Aspergillus ochraceoroseus IBT 24754]PTU21526.1 hypothetical protein P175DRAFT_0531040 [Aspergillus ochraceoroseus IBT 24754]
MGRGGGIQHPYRALDLNLATWGGATGWEDQESKRVPDSHSAAAGCLTVSFAHGDLTLRDMVVIWNRDAALLGGVIRTASTNKSLAMRILWDLTWPRGTVSLVHRRETTCVPGQDVADRMMQVCIRITEMIGPQRFSSSSQPGWSLTGLIMNGTMERRPDLPRASKCCLTGSNDQSSSFPSTAPLSV